MSVSQCWLAIKLRSHAITLGLLLLIISLSVTSFCALILFQKNLFTVNTSFSKDLTQLIGFNLLNSVDCDNLKQLMTFVEKLYLSISSIKYISLYNTNGDLIVNFPLENSFHYTHFYQDLLYSRNQYTSLETLSCQYIRFFQDDIINIVIPLCKNGRNIGTLSTGIALDPGLLMISRLIYLFICNTFVCLWIIVILFYFSLSFFDLPSIIAIINSIRNISSGNYDFNLYSISSNYYFNTIIYEFNIMLKKLNLYNKKRVHQLVLQKNKLKILMSAISEGVILIDAELRILFFNQIIVKIFNLNNLDIIGESLLNYLPLHVNQTLVPVFNRFSQLNYRTKYSISQEEVCIDFDYDASKIFRFILVPIIDAENRTLSSIAIILQDVSREAHLNFAKNQFIGNVSHELRTPLCNIGSFLETLLDYNGSLNSSQKIQFLTIANNETKRLSQLVNDILDLSRLESGHKHTLIPVNLVKICTNVAKTFQLTAEKDNINLMLEIDDSIGLVYAHQNSLFQVLSNLLSNALKFTHPSGNVVLRVYSLISCPLKKVVNNYLTPSSCSSVIRVEIADDGMGISERNQKIIFDRFVRIEDEVHTFRGTGLGLSIVQNILHNHDTSVFINSFVPIGTILYFDLFQI
uniref:Uncharacterized sensor-like histidine kinase ycf26 n=1 Tax=Spyridia filamentosa TaxID=196632 RepID=A0A1Z1MJY5_SPYFI|nr:Drug sensory protein A [Spyridia filamentosa]ARW66135.1 Drug sensory protein A [Spyridia filamentosa]